MEKEIKEYLNYLGLEAEPPTVNFLQRLIQRHLSVVPYETFSKFHYFRQGEDYIPGLEEFVDNLREKGWGGTCYTLNINFSRLLTALGFDCSLVRVLPGHLAIMAELNSRRFYVDVGYGSPIMKPVELEAKQTHVLHGFGEEIIFSRQGSRHFEIDRRSNGKSFVKKTIDWVPLSMEDIQQDIKQSYEDSEDNITMRRITAVRFNGHECFFLRDSSMKVMTFRNISEFHMKDLNKWQKVVQEVYQIDPGSLAESIDFLQQRGVKLFPVR